jgi:predicted RNA-binding protein with PUA-like domain
MNRWWKSDSSERYWLESTDREDLGSNLQAPIADDSGKENWRYTLLREIRPGDVIFHYHKKEAAIVGRSVARTQSRNAPIVWGARGTFARKKGTQPFERPGLRVEIDDFERLENPITLDKIRVLAPQITTAKDTLEATFGKPLYAPVELSKKRPARMLQGYAFKLPKAYVEILQLNTDEFEELTTAQEILAPQSFPEGAVKRVTVNAYERNARSRKLCLEHWGYTCAACGFDFEKRYGALGKGFIHVHHIVPVSTVGEGYQINPITDLRPVCPNCHAMIHKTKVPATIDEIKRLLT